MVFGFLGKIRFHNGNNFVDVLKILYAEDFHLNLFIFYRSEISKANLTATGLIPMHFWEKKYPDKNTGDEYNKSVKKDIKTMEMK